MISSNQSGFLSDMNSPGPNKRAAEMSLKQQHAACLKAGNPREVCDRDYQYQKCVKASGKKDLCYEKYYPTSTGTGGVPAEPPVDLLPVGGPKPIDNPGGPVIGHIAPDPIRQVENGSAKTEEAEKSYTSAPGGAVQAGVSDLFSRIPVWGWAAGAAAGYYFFFRK